MKAKTLEIIGYAIGALGSLAGLAGVIVSTKQMEAEVREEVDRRLNENEEDEES